MTDKYTIDFTDQNPNRQFIIQPYSTNGPRFPTSDDLSSSSSDAATSLLLYGKGVPNYGERIAENFIHLLENFASDTEPSYPTAGQLWYRKDITPSQLYVFNETAYQIVSNPGGQGIDFFSVDGDLTSRFSNGFRIRIFDPSNSDEMEEYLIVSTPAYDGSSNKTTFQVTPAPSTTRANNNWYIGGWEPVLQNNTALTNDFDANGHRITNVADAQQDGDALNRLYADGRYVNTNGDTMTGLLTLSGDPVNALQAATKQYVDSEIGGRALLINGNNAMTAQLDAGGNKIVSVADPTQPQDAATKTYVDGLGGGGGAVSLDGLNDVQITPPPLADGAVLLYDAGGATWVNSDQTDPPFISRSGGNPDGVMTGYLTLNADPVNNLHAATKQYVDNQVSSVAGVAPVANTGHSYDSYNGILTLNRTDNTTFQIAGIEHKSLHIQHDIRPLWEDSITSDYLENRYHDDLSYPTIQSAQAVQNLSEVAAKSREANYRTVLVADGTSTTYTTYLPGLAKAQVTSVGGLEPVTNYPDSSTIEISGDYTPLFDGSEAIYIVGGENEPGSPYTISVGGPSFASGTTTIPIDETLTDIAITNDAVLVPASYTFVSAAADSDVQVFANDNSTSGIDISVQFVDPGTNSSTTVSVSGNEITVTLAHDGTNITATANDVVTAINTDGSASSLVTAFSTLINPGTGTGIVDEQTRRHLEAVTLTLNVPGTETAALPAGIPFNIINDATNAGTYTVASNGSVSETGNEIIVPITTTVTDDAGGLVIVEQRDAEYIAGYNHLQVSVNGQKYIEDTYGSASIRQDPGGSTQGSGFFPSAITGLQSGTQYSFTATFDGGTSIFVSVAGANAQTFSELIDQINSVISTGTSPAGTAVLQDRQIVIYSITAGTGSSVILEDVADTGETPLISSLTGEDVSGPPAAWSSTATYNVGDKVEYNGQYFYALQANTNVQPSSDQFVWRLVQTYTPQIGRMYVGTTYGFRPTETDGIELLYGSSGTAITFNNAPPQGAVIEAITSKTQVFAN